MSKHMYILADGGRIAASDPSEFVRVLREGSWFDSGCTDGEYMVNFSGRYRELHGVTVRTDTPELFHGRPRKSTVTSRAEQSVPLLLHSLPVWGRFTSGGDFSFFIAVTHPSFRFSKGSRENRPATEYFSRAI